MKVVKWDINGLVNWKDLPEIISFAVPQELSKSFLRWSSDFDIDVGELHFNTWPTSPLLLQFMSRMAYFSTGKLIFSSLTVVLWTLKTSAYCSTVGFEFFFMAWPRNTFFNMWKASTSCLMLTVCLFPCISNSSTKWAVRNCILPINLYCGMLRQYYLYRIHTTNNILHRLYHLLCYTVSDIFTNALLLETSFIHMLGNYMFSFPVMLMSFAMSVQLEIWIAKNR